MIAMLAVQKPEPARNSPMHTTASPADAKVINRHGAVDLTKQRQQGRIAVSRLDTLAKLRTTITFIF